MKRDLSKTVAMFRLSKVLRYARKWNSLIPDNAPRALENEQWLQTLENGVGNLETLPQQGQHNMEIVSSLSSGTATSPEDSRNFEKVESFRIISKPPETPTFRAETPVMNVTSLKYTNNDKFKQLKGNDEFVDVRIVRCKSGDGGDGFISFARDANRAVGPPDGGDGGMGGSIYIQTDPTMNTLSKIRHSYIAERGSNGAKDQKDGKRGRNVLIKVPVGTVVKCALDPKRVRRLLRDERTNGLGLNTREILQKYFVSVDCVGEYPSDRLPKYIQLYRNNSLRKKYKLPEANSTNSDGWIFKEKDEQYHREKDWFIKLDKKVKVHDFHESKDELVRDKFPMNGLDLNDKMERPVELLTGGNGGLGNMHFLTNMVRNPRFAKVGRVGIEQFFMFELKILADLGLVGFPNAGKSTILNKISKAKPRIGHWEFTTLNPTIGTVSTAFDQPTFTVADIPGIIEGASKDKGMGLEFLKHIERSTGLVFVLGMDKPNPLEDFKILLDELKDHGIKDVKRALIVCNKCDIDPDANHQKFMDIKAFVTEQQNSNWDIVPMSALNNENTDVLITKMNNLVQTARSENRARDTGIH